MFHRSLHVGLSLITGLLVASPGWAYSVSENGMRSPHVVPSLQIAQRLTFRVPNITGSPSRIGGFARGEACFTDSINAQRPIALIPLPSEQTNPPLVPLAKTVEAHPTFFVYLPNMGVATGEFVVWSEDQSNILTEQRIPLPQEAGVIPVRVPEALTLETGITYYWTLEVLCNEDDRSRNAVVEGLVQRIEPETTLLSQLNQAQPRDRPSLYANAGYWYETLASLAKLRYDNPADVTLQADWESLLESVNLDGVAEAALLEPATPSGP